MKYAWIAFLAIGSLGLYQLLASSNKSPDVLQGPEPLSQAPSGNTYAHWNSRSSSSAIERFIPAAAANGTTARMLGRTQASMTPDTTFPPSLVPVHAEQQPVTHTATLDRFGAMSFEISPQPGSKVSRAVRVGAPPPAVLHARMAGPGVDQSLGMLPNR